MYAKVFASLWDGTLGENWEAWSVFVYLLANCDASGVIDATPEAIAKRSSIPLESVERGLRSLEQPDRRSRSEASAGRRLVRLDAHRDWGWRIVNYQHYRQANPSERQAKWRSEHPEAVESYNSLRRSTALHGVTPRNQAEAEAEAEAELESTHSVIAPRRPPVGKTSTNGNGTEPDELTSEQAFHEVFWPVYPRKVARIAALKAWRSLRLKDDDQKTLDAIMAGLEKDKRNEWDGRTADKIPHASTWLNQRRWEDAA